MMKKSRRTHFAAQNAHGHAKEFVRTLFTIWARGVKNVHQLWSMRCGGKVLRSRYGGWRGTIRKLRPPLFGIKVPYKRVPLHAEWVYRRLQGAVKKPVKQQISIH
jgi:hypothetical protein